MKDKEFDELIKNMSKCEKCILLKSKLGKDCSLVNIFKNIELSKNIPSIWTDWYNRLNSKIFIIGQDWGPYDDIKNLNIEYLKNKNKANWNKLINQEKSLTKKQLTKYFIESSKGKVNSLDNIYFTNAIMCARKGKNYRGNDINLNLSTINCTEFLYKQIKIVEPKVVLTLGYYPLYSLSKIFNFDIEDTLSKTINKTPTIKIDNYIIIPLYHPAAQIKKEEQLKQYNRIWKYID